MTTTYNQAKRLKELGLPYGALQYYNIETEELDDDVLFYPYKAISAISVSEALQWIRENKGVECDVWMRMCGMPDMIIFDGYSFSYYDREAKMHCSYEIVAFDTYPEAESALLDELLTYLEQKR